jgi:hypothetical protein
LPDFGLNARAMKIRILAFFTLMLLFVAAGWSVFAPASSDTETVMAAALKPSAIDENLRVLADEIGGRVPGTPAMAKAVTWAVEAFKAAGADSVRAEHFNMPISWAEGATQLRVVTPVSFNVNAVSFGWAPSVVPPRRARVVDIGKGTAEEIARAGNLAGALLLLHSDLLMSWEGLFTEYLRMPPIRDAALKGGALGIAVISSREGELLFRHVGPSTFPSGALEKLPMLAIAREDGLRIARLLKAGKRVEAEFSIPNRIGGPTPTSNVVAEIRGSELPDEYVVLGAHLDSWDLGTGALDNGCNSVLVIDTLRALKESGVKPRRSIRFVLFGGEEQGMRGSLDYARRHRAELDHAVAVVIFDEGMGRVTGFSLGGRTDVAETLPMLIAPLVQYDATQLTVDAFIGTDNFDFLIEGVPTLVATQEVANYPVNYHASSDTLDKVDMAQLKKHVAIAAGVTIAIANAEQRIGPRQSRAEIARLMQQTGLDQQMKAFGFWDDWTAGKRGRQP